MLPPSPQGSAPGAKPDVSVLGSYLQGGAARAMATGPMHITPDDRLNALIVQASPADVDSIEQMIRVLDQDEVNSITPKPRLIPVVHKDAKDIAQNVREVYADRMVQSLAEAKLRAAHESLRPDVGRRHEPHGRPGESPLGRATAAGHQCRCEEQIAIVVAPDALFQEVRQLVDQLDVDGLGAERVDPGGDAAHSGHGGDPRRPFRAGRLVRAIQQHGRGHPTRRRVQEPWWMRNRPGQGGSQASGFPAAQPWATRRLPARPRFRLRRIPPDADGGQGPGGGFPGFQGQPGTFQPGGMQPGGPPQFPNNLYRRGYGPDAGPPGLRSTTGWGFQGRNSPSGISCPQFHAGPARGLRREISAV